MGEERIDSTDSRQTAPPDSVHDDTTSSSQEVIHITFTASPTDSECNQYEFCYQALTNPPTDDASSNAQQQNKPFWCSKTRELFFNGNLVKRFRVPSPNQEAVLTAFQEEQWTNLILDPLPPKPGVEVKRRLAETIKSLNRAHQIKQIRFSGDGTGRGVRWRILDDEQLSK